MIHRLILLFPAALLLAVAADAQDREVPYWATLRASEINMRVGPSADYKIAWVYRRKGLPVKVVRVLEGWRLIEDPAGDQGWVASRMLSADRSAMVTGEGLAPMRTAPADNSSVKWNLEPGVIGTLGDCEAGWCLLDVAGRQGYVAEARLWGPGAP